MILRPNKPGVLLSPETAYLLETTLRVDVLRQRVRGANPLVAQELLDLREVAQSFEPAPLPEAEVGLAEVAQDLQRWLTPRVVADLEGITDRAVRLACTEGRIKASQVGGQWQISRQAYENYRAARAA